MRYGFLIWVEDSDALKMPAHPPISTLMNPDLSTAADERLLDGEQPRLAALLRQDLLDTEAEAIFDALTRVASDVCGVPISLISLVDSSRQWFKSAIGLPQGGETPRQHAFCAHAIVDPASLFEVQDALQDSRFVHNPLVTGDPRIRFYAGMPIKADDGQPLGTLCVIDRVPRTLSETQRNSLKELAVAVERLISQRRLHLDTMTRLSTVYVETPALLYLLDSSGAVIEVSNLWLKHFGYDRKDVIGRNAREFMSVQAQTAFQAVRERLWSEDGCRDFPSQFMTAAGQPVDVLISASVERDRLGKAGHVKCVLVDVSRQLRLQVALEERARVDGLTSLPNRGFYYECLEIEIARASRYDRPLSILMFDVDRFKQINDRFGHQVGDQALVKIATCLRQTVRDCDIVGRIGGEEFAVMLPETGYSGAMQTAERLRMAIEAIDFRVDRQLPATLTVSIGVTTMEDGMSAGETMKRADSAMYAAKRAGRNRVESWESPEIGDLALDISKAAQLNLLCV
jgi:diguanylate cyclase (GGDEF)-like protein/PAS domain S-box-containing protein